MCTLHNVGQGDFLIRDVGVDFLGEVVVFTVHLCRRSSTRAFMFVAEPGHLCSHSDCFAEALIHVGAQVVYPLVKIADSIVHIAEPLIHVGAQIVYPLVKIADSIVHIAEALIHVGAKIVYSIVHIAEALIHVGAKIAYPLVKIVYSLA